MNARDKLNAWNVGAVVLAALFLANIVGNGLMFWIVIAIGIWMAVKYQAIR